jgi:hypothetical protein
VNTLRQYVQSPAPAALHISDCPLSPIALPSLTWTAALAEKWLNSWEVADWSWSHRSLVFRPACRHEQAGG